MMFVVIKQSLILFEVMDTTKEIRNNQSSFPAKIPAIYKNFNVQI